MPEFTIKEVRLPELHLPEIKRDDIVRSLSGVRLPEVDLAKARRTTIKVPAVSVTGADVGKVLAAGAALARFVTPDTDSRRLARQAVRSAHSVAHRSNRPAASTPVAVAAGDRRHRRHRPRRLGRAPAAWRARSDPDGLARRPGPDRRPSQRQRHDGNGGPCADRARRRRPMPTRWTERPTSRRSPVRAGRVGRRLDEPGVRGDQHARLTARIAARRPARTTRRSFRCPGGSYNRVMSMHAAIATRARSPRRVNRVRPDGRANRPQPRPPAALPRLLRLQRGRIRHLDRVPRVRLRAHWTGFRRCHRRPPADPVRALPRPRLPRSATGTRGSVCSRLVTSCTVSGWPWPPRPWSPVRRCRSWLRLRRSAARRWSWSGRHRRRMLPSLSQTPDELTAANGAAGIVEGAGILVGPLVAAVALASGGPPLVVVLAAAALLAAGILIAQVGGTSRPIARVATEAVGPATSRPPRPR